MELDKNFAAFLESTHAVTGMAFELCDATRVIFSTASDDLIRASLAASVADLCRKVIEKGELQSEVSDNGFSLIGVPLLKQEGQVGTLIAYYPNPNTSATEDATQKEKFLIGLAHIMEEKVEVEKELHEMAGELAQSFEELSLYSRVANQLKSVKFTRLMQQHLVDDLLRSMRSDLVFVDLPQHAEYSVLCSIPQFAEQIKDVEHFVQALVRSIPPHNKAGGEDDYFIVNDSVATPEYEPIYAKQYRFLAVPIRHSDEFYGWLGLASFNMKELFRRSELSLLISISEQLAVVIANVDLYRDLEQFVINVVRSLVCTIEAKDVYTRGHSERVSRYSLAIAERLGIESRQRDILNWAAILHDIGKIGIPESILNKTAQLTDEEYAIIKQHPEKGYTILEPLDQISESLVGILHHHERYDGTGYPKGLKGSGIPLFARIIAVADTFDAIASTRAYRPAKSIHDALRILQQVAGTQLDPDIVKIFGEIFPDLEQTIDH
ncbi:MAG: HD domain-containing phosphohydrolase [Pseudomonadota bacterium]